MWNTFRWMYEKEIPAAPTLWHKWSMLLIPVRCIDGGWACDVWRRRNGQKWEYRRRQESDDEWWARQLW